MNDSKFKDLAGLYNTGRLNRLEQAVEGAQRLFELGPIDDRASAPFSLQHACLIEMTDCFADGMATDVVIVGQCEIGGKGSVVEFAAVESALKVGLELGPERERAVAVERLSRHRK